MRRKVIWVAILLAAACASVAYANYPAPIFSATVIPAGSAPK